MNTLPRFQFIAHALKGDGPFRPTVTFDANGNPVTYDETAVQAYIDAHAYIAKRQAEYPPMTDYLDGIAKGDQAQIDKYIADCQAVKAKYPK